MQQIFKWFITYKADQSLTLIGQEITGGNFKRNPLAQVNSGVNNKLLFSDVGIFERLEGYVIYQYGDDTQFIIHFCKATEVNKNYISCEGNTEDWICKVTSIENSGREFSVYSSILQK